MTESVWQRASTVLQRSRLNQPPSQVILDIKIIKIALGITLIQSIIIAGVLAFTYHSPDAWFYPFYSLLQIGWVWDKITSGSFNYSRLPDDEENNISFSTRVQPNFPRNNSNENFNNLAPSVFYNATSNPVSNQEDSSLFSNIEENSIIQDSE